METDKPIRNTLRKAEKLRHKTLVDGVFAQGKSLYDFPLRVSYRVLSDDELDGSFITGRPPHLGPVQMLITVPKKKRRHAVDRVLMRRRIREAYRLSRHALKETVDSNPAIGTLSLAFIYIHNENCDYALVERKMKRILTKIADRLEADCQEADRQEEDCK